MTMPARLEGKQLVGSVWVRRIGKHRGFRERVISFTQAGVKVEPADTMQRQHGRQYIDKKVQSIAWPMFMNLYREEGELEVIVTTDKEGFVQSVQKEGANGVVKPAEVPAVRMLPCSGGWHLKPSGPTLVPETEFDIVHRGPNAGKIGRTCRSCRQKAVESNRRSQARKGLIHLTSEEVKKVKVIEPILPREVAVAVLNELDKSMPVEQPADNLPEWEITLEVVRLVEIKKTVKAKDWLDAGALASEEGKIVEVKRVG